MSDFKLLNVPPTTFLPHSVKKIIVKKLLLVVYISRLKRLFTHEI